MSIVAETERLVIRHFNLNDAEFIVTLLNDPAFIRNIADKKVRTATDAINYLQQGPLASYQRYGFGLNMLELKQTGVPIGMAGLLQRPELPGPDLGYALLPAFWAKGYAFEAAGAILRNAVTRQALTSVLAVTYANNQASIGLLTKLGFCAKGCIELYGCQNNLYQYQPNHQSC